MSSRVLQKMSAESGSSKRRIRSSAVSFCDALHDVVPVLDFLRRSHTSLGEGDELRVVEKHARQGHYALGHGRREQARQELLRQEPLDLADVRPESQAEQLVSFVEDQHAQAVERHPARLQVVEQSSWSSGYDVHAPFERVELGPVCRAPVDRDRADADPFPHDRELPFDLAGELARGCHDECLDLTPLGLDALDDGKAEAAGLAAAGDGLHDQVPPVAHHRNDAALHRHRLAPAQLFDPRSDSLGEGVEARQLFAHVGSILSLRAPPSACPTSPLTSRPRSIVSRLSGRVHVAGLRGIR